ncbi:MAG: TetR/AcrR family transcriptional regulator [Acidimicrobiales bacterium]
MSEVAPVDGRVARRDRNRDAVLDVVIELFTEGHLDPGPGDVARRVGLSSRSVYRYFEDRDSLLRAAIDRQQERVLPLFLIHGIGQGDLDDRIEQFVTARVQLYEAIAATARASRAHALVNPILQEQVGETRRLLGEQVGKQFAPELGALSAGQRRATFGAIDALCQLESLDHLRIHGRLSITQTRALLDDALHALLRGDRP